MHIVVIASLAESLLNFRGPLLRAMVGHGHIVTACAPSKPPKVIEELDAMGVAYREVAFERTSTNLSRDLATLKTLISILREIKPDIVLSYTIKPVIYGSLAARVARVPQICAMITGASDAFASDYGIKRAAVRLAARLLYKISLPYNRIVFFQNDDDKILFEQYRLIKKSRQLIVTTNGSGVDLQFFTPALLPSTPSFLLMARLIADKGIREYVEAARIIRAEYPGIIFRLAGSIDQHPSAINEEELRIWIDEGVVEYLGLLDDVRPAIAASAVYVLPSYYPEGTPRSILEAMAMGRPVVTTDTPGCRETVISGVNGYFVPARDAGTLASTLLRFIQTPGLIATMGEQSRQIAAQRYDVHKVNTVILQAMSLA